MFEIHAKNSKMKACKGNIGHTTQPVKSLCVHSFVSKKNVFFVLLWLLKVTSLSVMAVVVPG